MVVEFVFEIILIKDVLSLFIKKRKNVVVVLDEYGGILGIIMIEDIVEEFFGEIEDEYDLDEELIEEELKDGKYFFLVRFDVVYLNEIYKLEIFESDFYGILGGFIVDFMKDIFEKGEKINIGNYFFVIEECLSKKIELVKLIVKE